MLKEEGNVSIPDKEKAEKLFDIKVNMHKFRDIN